MHAQTRSPDSEEFVYLSINSSVYRQERGVVFSKAPSSYSFLAPTILFFCNVGCVGESCLGPQETNESVRAAL